MEERQRLYDLLDRLGMRDKLARETIALLLEIDPELERPIEHDYQLVGERIGRCYTTQPIKPKYFLRVIKKILELERSSQHDTD